MNWKLQVPKILHVYWGVGKLPYLRYLTVATFMKFNPDWEVWLWQPKYPSRIVTWQSSELNYQNKWDDWTDKLLRLKIRQIKVDFMDFGIRNEISEVHKSDFLRFYFLSEYGGVYSDMDIIYFRPITKLAINRIRNVDKETFVCISHYGHSNGFFISAKCSKFFRRMFEIAHIFDQNQYQSAGPNLCNSNFPTIESIQKISSVENIGMEAVYYYNGQSVNWIYQEGNKALFNNNSIGCHWYAGSALSGNFLNKTNGGLINLPNNIIGKLCRITL